LQDIKFKKPKTFKNVNEPKSPKFLFKIYVSGRVRYSKVGIAIQNPGIQGSQHFQSRNPGIIELATDFGIEI